MIAIKYITKEDTSAVLSLGISGFAANYDAKGIYLKFEDSTLLKFPDAKIECRYVGGYYGFSGYLVLTEENISSFYTKRIIKYALDNLQQDLSQKTGDKLKAYIQCIWDRR